MVILRCTIKTVALNKCQICIPIVYQKYTYAIPLAISMSKVPHGQKVQKVKKRSSKRA